MLNQLKALSTKNRKQYRQIFLSAVCCHALTTAVYASSELPELKMVIFNQKPAESALQPLLIEQARSDSSLQMVIFNQETSVQESSTTATATAEIEPTVETSSLRNEFAVTSHLKAGYQRNNVNWTIADPSGTPNILSELQWKKVESAVLETGFTISYADSWQAEANFGYGYTLNGRNQDSDYYANNRQDEFSRSYSLSEEGSIFDISAALGYRLQLGNKSIVALRVTPKIGYAYHTQQFNATQGVQVIPANGNFGGLNSTYDASWFGPWAGLSAEIVLNQRLSLQSAMAYHLAKYEGTGNWNLRGDFQHPTSFRHVARGEGIVASAGLGYLINPDWTVQLSADYQHWKARNQGLDTTFFSDGYVGETKFNQVNWNSYGFNLGMEYHF